MNVIKFSGIVDEFDGHTYTFIKMYRLWVVVKEYNKIILSAEIMNNKQIVEKYQLDLSKYV